MARKVGQIVRRGPSAWLVRLCAGRDAETQKRKYLSTTVHGGLRDAQTRLHHMINDLGLRRNLGPSRLSLNDYLDQWLEVSAGPRLRLKSFQDYKGLLRRYVRPQIGTKMLASLQPFDLQTLYRDLLERGLSARTLRYTHAVLRSAFKQAIRWKLLLASPADGVVLPRETRRPFRMLTIAEARTFIKAIAGHPYETLFALAFTTGMRPSEYLALTWRDLNFSNGTVSVSRTLEWRKGGWQFADTKRARSRRVIKLQPWVFRLLEKQCQDARANQSDPAAKELIFVAKRGGPIRESSFARRYFKPLLKSAGLPEIRLYELRHVAASLSLSAGVSPKVISEQLGHASVAFTLNVYSHVLPHMQEAAALKVEALLLADAP